MNISEIKSCDPFNRIFPIADKTLSSIAMNMRRDGYDPAHPVIVWKGKDIVIDGHTRIEAARLVGLSEVPVVERDFTDEDEAVRYAISCQRDRRNLTDADILRLVEELDKRKAKGERTDLASSDATSGKSAADTAKTIGTSTRKVEKARTVKAKASPEVKAAVESGDMSLNKAYESTRTPQENPPDGTSAPSNGLQYAGMAISALSKIERNDTERAAAFDKVYDWLSKRRKDRRQKSERGE